MWNSSGIEKGAEIVKQTKIQSVLTIISRRPHKRAGPHLNSTREVCRLFKYFVETGIGCQARGLWGGMGHQRMSACGGMAGVTRVTRLSGPDQRPQHCRIEVGLDLQNSPAFAADLDPVGGGGMTGPGSNVRVYLACGVTDNSGSVPHRGAGNQLSRDRRGPPHGTSQRRRE